MGDLKDRELADLPFAAVDMGKLVALVDRNTISSKQAQQVWAEMVQNGGSPGAIVAKKGMTQISDPAVLGPIVDRVLTASAAQADRYRDGEQHLLGFFVGQVMKASRGKADPRLANQLLRDKLS